MSIEENVKALEAKVAQLESQLIAKHIKLEFECVRSTSYQTGEFFGKAKRELVVLAEES